ncbi:MAG: carboxypeptidase-like regulatory domain-containing protein [Candidatus Acidiferrum sp.]
MKRISSLFCLGFFLLFCLTPGFAQTGTTSLRGTVVDPNGAVIPGAQVTLASAEIGVSLSTQTDKTGFYQFQDMRPATYVLTITAPGFATLKKSGLVLLVSTPATSDVQLQIASGMTTVEVQATLETVNTQDATVGNTFDSKQILALPFEGRDAAGVLSLQPGVTFIANANPTDNVDTRNGALNGGRSDQANITLDGVDNNQQSLGTAFQGAVRSTLDSIEEFRVTTIGDNADQGRSSGGQVTLVTKSGTNTFHGSLYEQNRPTVTTANDWFNKQTELSNGLPNIPGKIIRNTFGGSLGGPIIKDRLFFFGTYEGQRQAENQQVQRNVPAPNLQDGVVFYPCADPTACTGNSVQGLTKSWTAPAGAYAVGPAQIAQMDPNCSTPVLPNFPNGSCPNGPGVNQFVANAQGTGLFQQYPTANSSACANADGFNISCYSFSAPNPKRLNTTIAKLDYNLNRAGTHRLFVRGNYQTDKTDQPPQFPGQPPATVLRDTSRAIAAGYAATFSSTLTNNLRFGLTRQSQDTLGLENGPNVTFRYFDDLHPTITSGSYTEKFHIPVYNWVDDVSWSRGKHTLQFGVNVRRITNSRATDYSNINYASTNPNWLAAAAAGGGGSFDPSCATDQASPPAFCTWNFPAVDPNNANPYNYAIVNVIGLITSVTGQYNRTAQGDQIPQNMLVPKNFRSWESDFYVQDSWKLTPNLTITAGLRYSLLEPVYETNGNQVSPDQSLNQFVNNRAMAMAQGQTFDETITYSPSGQANGKKPFWPWDYHDLGPRLALAYSPNPSSEGLLKALFGGAGKTSIRGGFGIVYDHFGTGLVNTFDENGAFGLNTVVGNPASVQTLDGSARFTALNQIPNSSEDGVLLNPAPTAPFPYTPPVSTLNNPLQQITWGFDDKLRTPYSETIDFSVTRELPGGLTVEAAYVGRLGRRLLQQRDLAMPLDLKDPKSGVDYFTAATAFAKLAQNNTPVSQVPNMPYWQNLFPNAAGVSSTSCIPNDNTPPENPSATQAMYELFSCNWGPSTFGASNFVNIFDSYCFPACANIGGVDTPYAFYNTEFSALYAWSSIGNSAYNAGQFMLRSRQMHGLQFDFNYVYSKSIDEGSDAERATTFGGLSAIINTWDPAQMRGPSDFDLRHQINSNWVYDLPFGQSKRFGHDWNRFTDVVLGGWELSGIYRWTSGFPFSVDAGGTYNTNYQLEGKAVQIGHVQQGLTYVGGLPYAFNVGAAGQADPSGYWDSVLRLPYPGESGQRNNFRGQGFFGIDAGINKNFHISERQTLRFSASAFNLTNSVRFDAGSLTNNSAFTDPSTIGLYSKTLTKPRVMEFALRYSF